MQAPPAEEGGRASNRHSQAGAWEPGNSLFKGDETMTGWYKIIPSGPITIGNLTPVGQNSGQVGCRWPPNGHQLAACLNLPSQSQLWGPFWEYNSNLYVPLPLPVYTLDLNITAGNLPRNLYRMQWTNTEQWQVQPEHQGKEIEVIGGKYLIPGNTLQQFWQEQKWIFKSGTAPDNTLQPLPWQSLTLSHNRRQDFQVVEEGGFFAEQTTLMAPGWSILVKIIGDYQPPDWGILGAGTPVTVSPIQEKNTWQWLTAPCPQPQGGILLTAALWQQPGRKISVPKPPGVKGYAAEVGVPWQSWKKVRDRKDPNRRVSVLTPGEWMTPAGAVYLWEETPPLSESGPYPDAFHRDALGYGHLWLF